MAAENAQIRPGYTVAVWGCGPVAQFAIKSFWMLGAGRVIGIDCVSERLQMAGSGRGSLGTSAFEDPSVSIIPAPIKAKPRRSISKKKIFRNA